MSRHCTWCRRIEERTLLPADQFLRDRLNFMRFGRDADGLLRTIGNRPSNPRQWLDVAWAHRWRGDQRSAAVAFDSARVGYERLIAGLPGPGQQVDHNAGYVLAINLQWLGFAYAGLGRAEDVAVTAERIWALSLLDASDIGGTTARAAAMLADAGLVDEALEFLERLAATPRYPVPRGLRLDPFWDPIREHPRFQALLAGGAPSK